MEMEKTKRQFWEHQDKGEGLAILIQEVGLGVRSAPPWGGQGGD